MTILPALMPSSVLGLTVGCAISNSIGFAMGANIAGPFDVVFGAAATLVAALCTMKLKNITVKGIPLLAPLPPVVFNALVIGGELHFFAELPLWLSVLQVGFGQLVVCYGLGIPLYMALKKVPNLFENNA